MSLSPALPQPLYLSLLLKFLILNEAAPVLYVNPDDESPTYLKCIVNPLMPKIDGITDQKGSEKITS